ncbi:MAG: SBBP repeat-containing protein, partial [Chitinophagales bacterium]|nr:SBBP repeat-containing protein [Chitinophagales bacterium]
MKKISPPFVLTFFLIFELLNKALANPDSNNEFFIENKGQWPGNVLFQSKLKGQDLWITKDGFVIDQYEIRRGIDLKLPEHFSNSESFSITKVGHAVAVSNIGASTKTTGSGKHLCKGIYNYFSGPDPSNWISNVSLYKEVEIKNIYPNVNQRWYFDNGMPRFDYVVLPGGKPQNIKLKIEGANNVSLQDNQLVFSAGSNSIRLSGLYAYQVINEKRVEIPSSWVIDENGNAGFLLGSYNKNLPVVIDPIIWSAYLGGTGADIAVKVRTDNSGNVYVTGLTASNNFPTVFGSYSISQIGSDDVFVTKTNGNTLIYSTYIGSTGIDRALAVRVENGNAIVGGFCSNGFPTNLAHQPTFGGSLDGFLLKLNAAGNGLIFSTYLGSHFNDFINDLDINQNNGRIYVTGYTKSNLFPVTTGAYDVSYNWNDDIFITCYSSAGNLLFSTFLGGDGDEVGQSVKIISATGDVVIGGSSRSEMSPPATNGIPVTAGAGANFYGSSSYQAPYLAILDSNLTTFKRGFFVAAHEGRVYGMDQDEYNRVFVVGTYGSSTHTVPSFTIYPLAFKNTPEPNTRDGFMFVLSSTGVEMSSTLYGGALNDYFLSVKVENSHNVTITGYSFSSDFPVSPGAHKNFLSGASDAIILKLNFKSNTEWEVLYSSYLGGSSEEISYDVDANSQGQAFFVGRTNSSDFPTSTGSFGNIYKGAIDAFVTSMCLPLGADVQVYNQSTFDYYYIDTINICEANTIILTAFPESYNIQWSYPGGSSSSSVIYIDSSDVSEQGTYSVVVHRPGICASSKSFSKHFTFRPNPSFNVYGIPLSSLCEGLSLQLITDNNDAQNYFWYSPWNTYSSNSNDTFSIHNLYSIGNPHYVYVTLSDSTGCSTTKEFNVYVQKCHDYKWEGNVDNDWFNPANWHMGMIPGSCSDNTLISTEGPYLPIIASGTIQVGNLILANNAEILLLAASSSLNVCGNIIATPYHGASFSGLGKVELNGTSAQSLDGKMKFDILRLNNS